MSISTVSTTTSSTPARTIGPVTTASGGGVALSVIIAWVAQQFFNVTIPPEVQGSIGLVLVILAGWLVKPATTVIQDVTGKHSA